MEIGASSKAVGESMDNLSPDSVVKLIGCSLSKHLLHYDGHLQTLEGANVD